MTLQDKLKPWVKLLKISSLVVGSGLFIYYHIDQTLRAINRVVNTKVLNSEKKHTPEFIYLEDNFQKHYPQEICIDGEPELKYSMGLYRVWKNFRHSVAWKLVWLSNHGNKDQRNTAITHLANFRNNKDWEYSKLAQAIDHNTAVLLARTKDVDNRFFLPPPVHIRRAALTPELTSYKLRDLLILIENLNPHSCIEQFISKYFFNVQEQAVETENIPCKPDSISERQLCILCLDAIYHHLTLFTKKIYVNDTSAMLLINNGILCKLSELILRYPNDSDVDLAVLRILTVLSAHQNLLKSFYESGLLRDLSRLIKSKDIRMCSSAAICLVNLAGEGCYRPGLFLLHPLYRTPKKAKCDCLLIHGLRGGVFVTWRQRDKACGQPVGLVEVTISDVDCDPCIETDNERKFIDPDMQSVIEDLIQLEDEKLLSDFEVVLQDVPISAKRESRNMKKYTATNKLNALTIEENDRCHHTQCWPKDWLPIDCQDIRILGVNYWSSLSEWLEPCPLQTAEIATRAEELAPTLLDANVGKNIPIVWLAHSMGGLIIKQLMVSAASDTENSDLQKLCQSTKAILFFSTPHKGSTLASMPRAAAAVLWPSPDVKQLQENSPVLLNIHEEFINFADIFNWETISFAESKPTLVTAFKVPVIFVENDSADLGRGVFYELALDHLSICKPATRQSVLYTTVLDVIQRVTLDNDNISIELNNTQEWLQNWIFVLSAKTNKLLGVNDKLTYNPLPWLKTVVFKKSEEFSE